MDKIIFSFSLDGERVLGYIARVKESVHGLRPTARAYVGPAAVRDHRKVVTTVPLGGRSTHGTSRETGFARLASLPVGIVQNSGHYSNERSESEPEAR